MNFKFISAGAGLFVLGAAFGWAITADSMEAKNKKTEEDLSKAIDDLRAAARENINLRYELNDKIEENENLHLAIDKETGFLENSEADSEISPGGELVEIDSGGKVEELAEHQVPTEEEERELEEQRAHLEGLIRGFIPTPIDEQFVERERPIVASTKYDPPFVISRMEFSHPEEEGDDYAKITLTYYPNDQVLLDEDEDPVEDVDRTVGWRSLNRFGDMSEDPDVVYVRNRRTETDYEIERVEGELPAHVKYAMPRVEFAARRAAGKIRLPSDDEGE